MRTRLDPSGKRAEKSLFDRLFFSGRVPACGNAHMEKPLCRFTAVTFQRVFLQAETCTWKAGLSSDFPAEWMGLFRSNFAPKWRGFHRSDFPPDWQGISLLLTEDNNSLVEYQGVYPVFTLLQVWLAIGDFKYFQYPESVLLHSGGGGGPLLSHQ